MAALGVRLLTPTALGADHGLPIDEDLELGSE
jgi:hypothetical protein